MFKHFVLLISFPLLVNSQTSDTTKKHKVLIGINGSCNYSYRSLSKSATKGDALTNTVIGLRNPYEKFDIGYAFGLEFQYKFNKTFSLRTGLNYNMYAYKSIVKYFSNPSNDPYIPRQSQDLYQFDIIDLPIKLGINYSFKKMSLHGAIGLSANYYFNDKYTMRSTYSNGDVVNSSKRIWTFNPNLLSLGSIASIGLDYNISKLINVRFEPTFKYNLTSINDGPILTRPFSFNANFGLLFKL